LRVPIHLDRLLEKYIKLDAYKTKSEFIRAAVREKLKEEFERLKREGVINEETRMEE